MDGYKQNKCGNKYAHVHIIRASWRCMDLEFSPQKESLYNTDRLLHVARYGMDNV